MTTLQEKLDQAILTFNQGVEQLREFEKQLTAQQGAINCLQQLIAEEETSVAPEEVETNDS